MTRKRDDEHIERGFDALRQEIDVPGEERLRALARTASGAPRKAPAAPRRRLPLRLRWTVAATTAALLVGSGLGFGVGNSVTPTVQAGTTFTGTGFLPAQGWNVIQSGTAAATKPTTATAANVPLQPDALRTRLPQHGVLIHATFTTRGDPARDYLYRERTLPLQMEWAEHVAPGRYRLRAGTGGYNVDALVRFGSTMPTDELLGEAQLQLSRLVVAPERVTLSARPTSLRWSQPTTLFGAISSSRPDEEVTLQAKDCGQRTFTAVALIHTHEGGSFSTDFARAINSTIRAVWNGEASPAIEIKQQPSVFIRKRDNGRIAIGIGSRWTFWHKRVLLQRRVGSRWVVAQRVLLTESFAQAGAGSTVALAEFRPRVPRGSIVRAMLPADQAKPCYLPAASDSLRW